MIYRMENCRNISSVLSTKSVFILIPYQGHRRKFLLKIWTFISFCTFIQTIAIWKIYMFAQLYKITFAHYKCKKKIISINKYNCTFLSFTNTYAHKALWSLQCQLSRGTQGIFSNFNEESMTAQIKRNKTALPSIC